MKNYFESSLRPVSADKRLVAREVAFTPNPLCTRLAPYTDVLATRKYKDQAPTHVQLTKSINRPDSQESAKSSGLSREARAYRRIRDTEKQCSVKRDREIARLQLERAWLKRKIVLILKMQYVYESSS